MPITPETKMYFQRQYSRYLSSKSNEVYKDHGLVICRNNGEPYNPSCFSSMYPNMIKRIGMNKLTIQGLRRSAASNLYSVSGSDPYTISRILGHTIRGLEGEISNDEVSSITYRYIDVAMEKKTALLRDYHKDVFMNKSIDKKFSHELIR